MDVLSVFVIAIGLAMDAFAVSMSHGIALKDIRLRHIFRFGIYFGVFQFIMPLLGYLGGRTLSTYITAIDHWIAFGLLSVIGGKMLYETFGRQEECVPCSADEVLSFKKMLLLAIATSIDALAVGISFAVIETDIITACTIIGLVAFVLSCVGVCIGKKVGCVFQKSAERLGGIILIGIGIKILVEHLFFN